MKLKDIIGGLIVVIIIVFLWSWCSNIAPEIFLDQPQEITLGDIDP